MCSLWDESADVWKFPIITQCVFIWYKHILETIFLALNCTGFGLYWCVILIILRMLMVYDYDRNSEAIDVMIFVMMGASGISVWVIWLRRILLCL